MQNRILLIIPFFGKLPPYFALFLNSVASKKIDIIFLSDLHAPKKLPSNIKWEPATLNEIKDLFISKLGVEIALENAYKLCDLRPAFGIVFEEIISGYEFWGSIDTDVVLGNFDKFISDELLNEIDFFSGIKEYISGSFFFIRNNTQCNNLFKKSQDWVKVFNTAEYCGFDECGGKYYTQLKEGADIFKLNIVSQSFTQVVFLEIRKGLRAFFENVILEPRGFNYVLIDGGVKYLNKEYLMIHFIFFKTRYYFKIYPGINSPTFYINGLGNFKRKPNFLRILFSKNLLDGFVKKIQINLEKIKI